jgi:hypothetical protein
MNPEFESMLATLKTRAAAFVANPSGPNRTAYQNAITPIDAYLQSQRQAAASKEAEVRRIEEANKQRINQIRTGADKANKEVVTTKSDTYTLESLEQATQPDYTPLVVKGLIVAVLGGLSMLLLG